MMSLCQNREEGFGPSSKLSSIPTTCFVDTVIIPIPVWIYLLLLPTLFVLTSRLGPSIFTSTSLHRPHRSCLRLTATVFYYGFIIAQILMLTLELVRLAMLKRSPDLLPFQYVALLLGAFLHMTNGAWGHLRAAYWKGANVFVWVGLLVVSCVKVAGLGMMMDMNGEDKGLERPGSKYPLSDQVIDVAVSTALYAIIAILEVVLGVWMGGKQSRRANSATTEEERIVKADTGMTQVV